jgi:hypothetical protein
MAFFQLNALNATKDRAISGKQQQANPFEFCSNEFSSGGAFGGAGQTSSDFNGHQQIIDNIID